MIQKANPVDLRKAIEVANIYVKAGILFVPMPVLNKNDHAARVLEAELAIEALLTEAEKGGAA